MKSVTATIAAGLHRRRGRLCVRLRRRAAEIGAQSLRRASGRLSDRRRGREPRQEAVGRHQGPSLGRHVSVDAARRRKGSDRAGAGRRHRLRARFRRRARPGGRRSQRVQPALRVPQYRAHAACDRRRRSARNCSTRSPTAARASSASRWMDAGARNFYDTKKPIKTMADLKGMKIRVMGNPMFVDMANSMGANGVADGLRPGVQRAADRRGRRRREQSAELRVRQPLSGREVLHDRRAPDRAGDAGDVEEDLRTRCRRTTRRC